MMRSNRVSCYSYRCQLAAISSQRVEVASVVGNSASVTQLIPLAKAGLSVFEQVLCDELQVPELK